MTLRFRHFAIFWVLLASFNSWSQTPEPQQIDQFGKINSEETEARLESAVTKLRNNPGTFLKFVIHRGEADPPGWAYRTFGIQKAFMLTRKLDPKRIISTFCDAQQKRNYGLSIH